MKKLPYIIGIPIVAVVFVVGGALIWRVVQPQQTTTQQGQFAMPNGSTNGAKPANPFSALFGGGGNQVTPIPTPTPASVAAMNADLKTIGDDGGASDFSSLNKDLNSL